MQVAPMPDKPPFMNGLTAFQVALSFRDMTMRSCGACGDVLRADLGADAFSFATERLSPEPAAAGDFAISVVRHEFRVGIFCESVASRGESRVINPRRIEKRKPLLRAFFCRHRETGTRAISRNLFSKKDHSRRAVRVTIEAPGARDAFGGASRRTVGSCAFPVARTRARAHVARAREHTALSVVRATAKRGARVQP